MCPEFITFINQYDLIRLQETKLDDADLICVEGYQVHNNNRKSLARHRSGGITILIKNNLVPNVKVLKNDSKLVSWLIISNKVTTNREDLFCGVVYIPPYHSKYATPDPYLEFQNELDRYCLQSKNIILMGDFNSRTREQADFTINDEFLCDIQGNSEMYNEHVKVMQCFENQNVSLKRSNIDKTTNYYGSQLIDFCKSNTIFILNGRQGFGDQVSKCTCKDRSVIDYFMSTAENFSFVENFEVVDFCSLYSDAHCPVSINININNACSFINDVNTDKLHIPEVKLWDETKCDFFQENLSPEKLLEIKTKLDQMNESNLNVSAVNDIVVQIENLFKETAKSSFGVKNKCKKSKNYKQNKVWFNKECHTARNEYHLTRKLYNKHKTKRCKEMLKTVSKKYKTTLSQSMKRFKNERVKKLKNLKSSNPKDFWKIINSAEEKDKCNAPIKDIFDYFKNTNNAENIKENENEAHILSDINPDAFENINIEINRPITKEEILKAVKNLKNNKSPGVDAILNEHIKCSIDSMMPIYENLFNNIFDHGFIPDSWSLEDILPIYKNKGSASLTENYCPITLLSCLGKMFTSIINSRLNEYAENVELISPCQAGFRKGFSTADNLFAIQGLLDILKAQKHKLYAAFIDFKQAFDMVWRNGL